MQKQKISTHHPRIVDYSYSTSTVMFALLILLLLACVRRESKRMMCWGRSTCRRHQCTSDQARSRRGPMLISVVMSQWRWSIGVVRPNDGGSLYGAPFFTVRGLELSGSSRKKWLLVASKPPITKLTDCPCSIYYGGELCSFRVMIYCMLAMGPGQLYTLFFWYSQSCTYDTLVRGERREEFCWGRSDSPKTFTLCILRVVKHGKIIKEHPSGGNVR